MLNRFIYIFLITLSFVGAQINGKSIALLNFKGVGLNTAETVALTNVFNGALTKTKAISLLDRKIIKQTFSEQSMVQVECNTSECISKAGASLSVDLIMTGIVQKKNDFFSLEVNIYEVSNAMKPMIVTSLVDGKVVVRKRLKESKISPLKTKKINYSGNTDGFINTIEIMAWELMELKVPDEKIQKRYEISQVIINQNYDRNATIIRSVFVPGLGQMYSGQKKWGWLWLSTETLLSALAYSQYRSYASSLDNYRKFQNEYGLSIDPQAIELFRLKAQKSRKEMIASDGQMTATLYALGGIWMANIFHASIIRPKGADKMKKKNSVDIIYNNIMMQPQLSFSVNLD
jgi:hypothetical protein